MRNIPCVFIFFLYFFTQNAFSEARAGIGISCGYGADTIPTEFNCDFTDYPQFLKRVIRFKSTDSTGCGSFMANGGTVTLYVDDIDPQADYYFTVKAYPLYAIIDFSKFGAYKWDLGWSQGVKFYSVKSFLGCSMSGVGRFIVSS